MSHLDQSPQKDTSETILGFVESVSRLLMFAGLGALIIGVGFLIYTAKNGSVGTEEVIAKALENIELFGKVAVIGGIVGAIGAAWLLWGEETLGPLLLVVGCGLFFSPSYLPSIITLNETSTTEKAIEAVATAGLPVAIVGVLALLADLIIRMRTRVQEGARADQIKLGKGIKEERDIRNVFLGKCWQLPYCRKFVRERCPIYHARRSCWNERVGCMCEESVIQNAMEGKVIPSDIVAASKFIPQNAKLTAQQKVERCRQCVIYNEHQKHKYQLSLPASALGLVAIYVTLRVPMKDAVQGLLLKMDRMMNSTALEPVGVTGDAAKVTSLTEGVIPYAEIILVACFLIVFAYAVRIIEYLFFKLKI